jgi:hypothetical protein
VCFLLVPSRKCRVMCGSFPSVSVPIPYSLTTLTFDIVACRAVCWRRQRIRMQQQRYCWKRCFRLGPCKGVTRTTEARKFSWNGAAVQRGSESESRGLVIVRSRNQATTSEDTAGWKDLACALEICEVWKLTLVLWLSVITSCVLKWSINPMSHLKPRLESHTRANISS